MSNASVKDILASIDSGEDPELAKVVTKRSEEWNVSRLEALRRLLREG